MNNKKLPKDWAVFQTSAADRAAEKAAKKAAKKPDELGLRVADLHAQLREADPAVLAAHTGATYYPSPNWAGDGLTNEGGVFHLLFWGREVILTFPDFEGRDGPSSQLLGTFDQAQLAYYFTISDGTPQTGRWISFSELPDGTFYTQAFQGYTGNELLKVFGNDGERFADAAVQAGGSPAQQVALGMAQSIGDQAFIFRVLPHVSLMIVIWQGDEDFPASYRILFDAAASHHLTTDACAILGSTLTRRLVRANAVGETKDGWRRVDDE